MSQANAKAFLKRLMESKDLVESCKRAGREESLKIAAALGFPHTAQEMQAVIDEGITKAKRRLGELSEAELESFSGGQGTVDVLVVPVVVWQILSDETPPLSPSEIDL
jgi:predicted ribosomally synthesized peptide with nif11-like leader